MSKIEFMYSDNTGFDTTRVEVSCTSAHMDAAVERFKDFLLHIGHHPDNVGRIVVEGREERQGLPQQLELPL